MIKNPDYPYGTDYQEIKLLMRKDDCAWLEKMYGKNWVKRLEQHILSEVGLRRTDSLKTKEPWNY